MIPVQKLLETFRLVLGRRFFSIAMDETACKGLTRLTLDAKNSLSNKWAEFILDKVYLAH